MQPQRAAWSARQCLIPIAFLTLAIAWISCSTGPPAARPGTPAFFFGSARESYNAGDYIKTLENLDNVLEADNEYTGRALPWALVLRSGLASGYMDLADRYQEGGKLNLASSGSFFKAVANYRSFANGLTLQFAEDYARFSKLKSDPVALVFGMPPGSMAPVPQLGKVALGQLLPPAEAEAAHQRALERGLALVMARSAGAPGDSAKAGQLLKSNGGQVPRATFILAMANSLYDVSQLYAKSRRNDREKMRILCRRAQEALENVPDCPESKDLAFKIRAMLKATERS